MELGDKMMNTHPHRRHVRVIIGEHLAHFVVGSVSAVAAATGCRERVICAVGAAALS